MTRATGHPHRSRPPVDGLDDRWPDSHVARGTRRNGNLVGDLVAGWGDFAMLHGNYDTVNVEEEQCAGHVGLSYGMVAGSTAFKAAEE
jgi:hypothetical protein